MTSLSSFRVSAPAERERVSAPSTPAETFLRTVKERNAGRLSTLPIRGGRTARFRKLDPHDEIAMTVHEAVTIIERSDDIGAVDYLRAITKDAGKAESICVKLATTGSAPSLETAELELVEAEAKLTVALDRKRHCLSLDRKELRDLEIGLEARARSAMLAAEAES